MTFQNNLYFIDSAEKSEDAQVFRIRMNPGNFIYRAHFPGMPITPGVCILQTGLELLSVSVGEKLELKTARNVKFLSILRPDAENISVSVRSERLEDGCVKARIEMGTPDAPIAKMSLICRTVQQS